MTSVRPLRSSVPARRTAAVVLAAALALAPAAGCGDDDASGAGEASSDSSGAAAGAEAGPAEPVALRDLAARSGDAPAATGAGLPQPPGPERRTGLPEVGETAASITAADGTVSGCCLLVAATPEQRQRGLMEVTDLGGYRGMVFVWDQDVETGFWMSNTPTPLSIAWFDADGDFVSSTDMAPCPATEDDCPIYPPDGPYRFAVEVFQGDLATLGVGPGSRLALGGDCARAAG